MQLSQKLSRRNEAMLIKLHIKSNKAAANLPYYRKTLSDLRKTYWNSAKRTKTDLQKLKRVFQ